MRQALVLLIALFATAAAAATAAVAATAASRPSAYVLPGNQVFPEGVAYRQGTDTFFAGSTTDGTIFRGDLDEAQAAVCSPAGFEQRTTATG